MWLLRRVKAERWPEGQGKYTQEDVAAAYEDLRLRRENDETGISVYKVADEKEAENVALLYAMTLRRRPQKFDYILIPDTAIADLPMRKETEEGHHPSLSDRHYEIDGLTDKEVEQLTTRLLGCEERRTFHLDRRRVESLALNQIDAEPQLADELSPEWLKTLEPRRSEPKSDS